MRKYLASLAFALTLSAVAPVLASAAAATDEAGATVAVQVKVPVPGLRDEAAMVLVGTALIGLGAAVRRSA